MNELVDRGLGPCSTAISKPTAPPPPRGTPSSPCSPSASWMNKSSPTPSGRRRFASIAAGISTALPNLHDPVALAKDAAILLKSGVQHDVNTLEYWGENPGHPGPPQPVAQAVYKMLGQAATEAHARADDIANEDHADQSGCNRCRVGSHGQPRQERRVQPEHDGLRCRAGPADGGAAGVVEKVRRVPYGLDKPESSGSTARAGHARQTQPRPGKVRSRDQAISIRS